MTVCWNQGNTASVRGTDHPRDTEFRDPPGMHELPMMNRMSSMKRVGSSNVERELEGYGFRIACTTKPLGRSVRWLTCEPSTASGWNA